MSADEAAIARHNMVECQLRPSNITDERILGAMGAVPREVFVPERLRAVAYADEDIEVGGGRRLIEPLALAKLVQAAEVGAGERVLAVGCATGYAAAVLARLAAEVVVTQADEAGVGRIEAALRAFDGPPVTTAVEPDLLRGHPGRAPYDAVLLLGAVAAAPLGLRDQLAEGGRLVAVVAQGRVGKLRVWTRVGEDLGERVVNDAQIPPLPVPAEAPGFSFI